MGCRGCEPPLHAWEAQVSGARPLPNPLPNPLPEGEGTRTNAMEGPLASEPHAGRGLTPPAPLSLGPLSLGLPRQCKNRLASTIRRATRRRFGRYERGTIARLRVHPDAGRRKPVITFPPTPFW